MLAIYAIPVIRICILVLSSYDQPFSMGYHGLFLKLLACESLQYCYQLTLYDCENIIPYLMNNMHNSTLPPLALTTTTIE